MRCSACGFVLEEFEGMPDTEFWYRDLYARLHHKCPKCGRDLPDPFSLRDVVNIDVSPNHATLRKSPLAGAFHHDYHKEVPSGA